jgi:hypothetical protein
VEGEVVTIFIRIKSVVEHWMFPEDIPITPISFETLPETDIQISVSEHTLLNMENHRDISLAEVLENLFQMSGLDVCILDAMISATNESGCILRIRMLTERDITILKNRLPSELGIAIENISLETKEYISHIPNICSSEFTEQHEKISDETNEPLPFPSIHDELSDEDNHQSIMEDPIETIPASNGVNTGKMYSSIFIQMIQISFLGEISLRQARCAYIIWDIENCALRRGVKREDDAIQVIRNVEKVIEHAVGYGWKAMDSSVEWSIFLNFDPENAFHPTQTQYKDLMDHCKMVSYPKKGSADIGILGHIDKLERRHRSDFIRPIVCLITGDRDFSGAVEKLKVEGFEDFVLIHKDDARLSLLSNAPYTAKWSDVRLLNEKSEFEQLDILPVPSHFRIAIQNILAAQNNFLIHNFKIEFEGPLSAEQYKHRTIFSVLHRLKSVGWVVCSGTYNKNTGKGLVFHRFTDILVELKRQSHAKYAETYIIPDMLKKYSSRLDEGIFNYGHVEIYHTITDRLTIRSTDATRAKSVASQIKSYLIRLTRCSDTLCLERWTNHHGDAFISSKVRYISSLCNNSYVKYKQVLQDLEKRYHVMIITHNESSENPDISISRRQRGILPNTDVYCRLEICCEDNKHIEEIKSALLELEPCQRTLTLSETVRKA